ncbi:unnamed protein product [Heterobilharzia americana]|nr:unnamed protein product [Heterobilharzia americana]CAH8623342.1 unnamed protein product [Heterobilharzia americana]
MLDVETGLLGMAHLLKSLRTRRLHSTINYSAGGLFRARRRLPPSGNEWGPLTDIPDYTIIEKPNPRFTSVGQCRRAIEQYNFANDVVRLTSEMKQTQERYIENKKFEREIVDKLKKECLKPKGNKDIPES